MIFSMVRSAKLKNDLTLSGPRLVYLEREIDNLRNKNRELKAFLAQNTKNSELEDYLLKKKGKFSQE